MLEKWFHNGIYCKHRKDYNQASLYTIIIHCRKSKYFYHDRVDWNQDNSSGRYVCENCHPFRYYLDSNADEHRLLFDTIEEMLEFDPFKRATLSQVLDHPYFADIHYRGNRDMHSISR